MVHAVISKCDAVLQPELCECVVITGGSMRFPGMADRLQRELSALFAHNDALTVKVLGPRDNLTAWAGGSLFGQTSGFRAACVTRSEYEESGPGIVHSKCA